MTAVTLTPTTPQKHQDAWETCESHNKWHTHSLINHTNTTTHGNPGVGLQSDNRTVDANTPNPSHQRQ